MYTRNTTPFLFAAFASSVKPPAPSMTLVCRAGFRLKPGYDPTPLTDPDEVGSLSGDVFAAEDDEREGALLRAGDFAEIKPRVDVLVKAQCHVPGGKPVGECPVRVSLGDWSKTLRVVGPRVWESGIFGSRPSAPKPFTTMPIVYANAFGGAGHLPNPVGMGLTGDDLPTLELPAEPIRSRDQRSAPACFGPVSPFWESRKVKLGKDVGAKWEQTRAPYWPLDFNAGYFQAAPVDQQLEVVNGGEELAFVNLHPEKALFSVKLPSLTIRAFVNDVSGRFREVPMRLDTVFADLEGEILWLTFRGWCDVQEDDLTDIKTVLVAMEGMGTPAKPESLYREELAAFEADPIGIKGKLPSLEGPAPAADDDVETLLEKKLANVPEAHRKTLTETVRRLLGQAPRDANVKSTLRAALSAPGEPAFVKPAVPAGPGGSPQLALQSVLNRVRETAKRLTDQLAQTGQKSPETEKLEGLSNHPLFASVSAGGTEGKDEPGPNANLSGRDFSGQNFAGKNLEGANLQGAILRDTNLEGANLKGAKLASAILQKANLYKADLTDADMTQAFLGEARASQAVFARATLDYAVFEKADLTEADLTEATARYALFEGARLGGARALKVNFFQVSMQDCDLEKANFTDATLERCLFANCKTLGAIFSGVELTKTSFQDSHLEGAIFIDASGEGAIFIGAHLAGANLSFASLPDSHFSGVNASETQFVGADLARARFYRASLVSARFDGANLWEADFRKATLDGASFIKASLYCAQLHGSSRKAWNVDGANLKRALYR